jgi:RNA polymerase sigma factor (sigma-70 family)
LVAGHRQFLAFLVPRVATVADAEEILQSAFVRSLEKGNTIEDGERSVAWFYRVLRNALIDYYRHRAVSTRVLAAGAAEVNAEIQHVPAADEELQSTVCRCYETLLPTLKPEYTEILRRVDLADETLVNAARALGISANNASVRLHRARQALRTRLQECCGSCAIHGCLHCTCDQPCR